MWKHVPNAITVFRLGLAAYFPFAPAEYRLWIILIAGFSDWIDGVIARRFNAMSKFGALMDGVADKAFLLTVLVTWVVEGDLAPWMVLLVMARDIAVGIMALIVVLHREWSAFGKMSARMPGKLTTAFLFFWFVAMLVPWAEPVRPWLFWAAAISSVWAAADYAGHFVQALRNRKQA